MPSFRPGFILTTDKHPAFTVYGVAEPPRERLIHYGRTKYFLKTPWLVYRVKYHKDFENASVTSLGALRGPPKPDRNVYLLPFPNTYNFANIYNSEPDNVCVNTAFASQLHGATDVAIVAAAITAWWDSKSNSDLDPHRTHMFKGRGSHSATLREWEKQNTTKEIVASMKKLHAIGTLETFFGDPFQWHDPPIFLRSRASIPRAEARSDLPSASARGRRT